MKYNNGAMELLAEADTLGEPHTAEGLKDFKLTIYDKANLARCDLIGAMLDMNSQDKATQISQVLIDILDIVSSLRGP